jgi:hypothetical protein
MFDRRVSDIALWLLVLKRHRWGPRPRPRRGPTGGLSFIGLSGSHLHRSPIHFSGHLHEEGRTNHDEACDEDDEYGRPPNQRRGGQAPRPECSSFALATPNAAQGKCISDIGSRAASEQHRLLEDHGLPTHDLGIHRHARPQERSLGGRDQPVQEPKQEALACAV